VRHAQQAMKAAVVSKDEALHAQALQLDALQHELDVTRDALERATQELENVCLLSALAARSVWSAHLCSTWPEGCIVDGGLLSGVPRRSPLQQHAAASCVSPFF
jgi:uncharacterized protein YgbK (DUF1537 family)